MSKETEKQIKTVCDNLAEFLIIKNRNYGNSALKPINVFSKLEPIEGLLTRANDKVNRIKNSNEPRKNDYVDLCGYLILIMINNEWLDFDDLID